MICLAILDVPFNPPNISQITLTLYSALLISDFWYLFSKPTWFQRSTSNFRWIREDIRAKLNLIYPLYILFILFGSFRDVDLSKNTKMCQNKCGV